MGDDWSVGCVGDFFELENGYAFKSREFVDEGTPVIKIKNIKAGFFSEHQFSYVDPKFADKKADKLARPNDLLISMSGNRHDGSPETWVGKVARFCKESPHLINQRVGALRVKPNVEIDPRFMSYLLSSWQYQSLFISVATSSGGQANLSPNQILGAPVEFPSVPNQKAIAHILGSLDDKIELNRKMNGTLESMAQAMFKSWFVDFDPVIDNALAAGNPIPEPLQTKAQTRKELGDQKKSLPPDIQKLFPNQFQFNEELGWIPEGWRVSQIGSEVEVVGGGTPSTKVPEYWDRGIHAFCTPKDMSGLNSMVLLDTERHLTDSGVNKITSGKLPRGTLVMSSRAPIGYLAISEIPVSVNQGIIAILPSKTYGPLYLRCWLGFNMGRIEDRANGSTFQEISKKNFRPIEKLVPHERLIAQFNTDAVSIYSRAVLICKNTNSLTKLRDTLLPKLLSGELRIPDAEKMVAEAV